MFNYMQCTQCLVKYVQRAALIVADAGAGKSFHFKRKKKQFSCILPPKVKYQFFRNFTMKKISKINGFTFIYF